MFNSELYLKSKTHDLVPCVCDACGAAFERTKRNLSFGVRKHNKYQFCSKACIIKGRTKERPKCERCSKPAELGLRFCSRECSSLARSEKISADLEAGVDRSTLSAHSIHLVECKTCKKKFKSGRPEAKFCSRKCYWDPSKSFAKVECGFCKTVSERRLYKTNRSPKLGLSFCNASCKAKYMYHMAGGKYKPPKSTRISAPHKLIMAELTLLFPHLELKVNDRETLESGLELDIFIPAVKFAIEVNGPTHYLPIYGEAKLGEVKHRDAHKFAEAHAKGISLFVVDSSSILVRKKSDREKLVAIVREEIAPIIKRLSPDA